MSESPDTQRSKGNVLIIAGIIIILCAIAIGIDFMNMNSQLNESESSGLLGAAMGMYEALSIWIGWLARSMFVTVFALLLAGGSFIYAGTAIKDTEAMMFANKHGIDPEDVQRNSVIDSIKDIGQTFTERQRSTQDASFLTPNIQAGGLGVILGVVFAFITNATLAGSLFWIVLFIGVSWSFLTRSGKVKREEIQRQLKLTLKELQGEERTDPSNQEGTYNCPHCGAKNEATRTTCKSCEITLSTLDD